MEHFDTICNSPSQIYHSALPFSPSSSWLHECYSTELSQEVKVVKGLPAEWGICFRTVTFDDSTDCLACWRDTIAVGLRSHIIILDGITGSQAAVLSGHDGLVRALTFSSDGTSLASGGHDTTVRLWDVQTGGVIKTFHGHTKPVCSVSMSADCTGIASGSNDKTIRLWDIQTRECYCVIEQQEDVSCVNFSPMDSQRLIFVFGGKVQQCNVNGHKINHSHAGSCVAFSPDGTQYITCPGVGVELRNSDSGAIVAKFPGPDHIHNSFCFSPDARLVAIAANCTIHIWDITSSDPHLVQTFTGHINEITALQFSSPSSIVSSSYDQSVKSWQIGAISTDTAVTNPDYVPALIKSVALQAKDGVTISSDSDGVVRTWDVSTGLCKASFQTPAKGHYMRDVRLINSRLKLVWWADQKIHIWDVDKGELLQEVNAPGGGIGDGDWEQPAEMPDEGYVEDIKISGDGSRVFLLTSHHIQVSSMQVGQPPDKLKHTLEYGESLIIDGSKLWVHSRFEKPQGWDFWNPPTPSVVELSGAPLLYLKDTMLWDTGLPGIKDAATGNVVFQLAGRFSKPIDAQLDSGYLVARFKSGDMLILDFNHMSLQ